jgi:hypothetical protein
LLFLPVDVAVRRAEGVNSSDKASAYTSSGIELSWPGKRGGLNAFGFLPSQFVVLPPWIDAVRHDE